MHITVVGLGYVGTVTGACLADGGHDVTIVDVNEIKIDMLNAGESPVVEFGLAELVETNVGRGRLRGTKDLPSAVETSDIVIICVGTPTGANGDVSLKDVSAVATQIGDGLRNTTAWRAILVTSTVPPGTVDNVLIPILEEQSRLRCGVDFGVAFSPEFLREGSAVTDFKNPPKTVVGATDPRTFNAVSQLYAPFNSTITSVTVGVAEMIKFTDNAWHALKVAFANEIGRFCDAHDLDSHAVMSVFKTDTRLNISPTYLTPGFAFGGSCLPKDLRTLTYRARAAGVRVPVLDVVLGSNREHIDLALRKVNELGGRKIALLGLAFKSGTDDLRESPMLELVERLLGKGHTVVVHDEHISPTRLTGSNREYVMEKLPHIASLLVEDLAEAVSDADIVIVAHSNAAFSDLISQVRSDQIVLDLTGVARPSEPAQNYVGLTW
jgi:GDP-mannose 6-dehydrogenase